MPTLTRNGLVESGSWSLNLAEGSPTVAGAQDLTHHRCLLGSARAVSWRQCKIPSSDLEMCGPWVSTARPSIQSSMRLFYDVGKNNANGILQKILWKCKIHEHYESTKRLLASLCFPGKWNNYKAIQIILWFSWELRNLFKILPWDQNHKPIKLLDIYLLPCFKCDPLLYVFLY